MRAVAACFGPPGQYFSLESILIAVARPRKAISWQIGHYWNHLRRAMGEVLRSKEEAKRVWQDHAEIFDAMAAGDGERAAQMIQAHLESAAQRVLAAVASPAKR